MEDTQKWLARFIDKKSENWGRVYVEDNHRFGRVAFAANGFALAAVATDDEPTGSYRSTTHKGRYPNGWYHIVPKADDATTTVTVWTEDLFKAAIRAQVFARHSRNTVHLSIEDHSGYGAAIIRVSAKASEIGEVEILIDAQLTGDTMRLAMNVEHILFALYGWSKITMGKRPRCRPAKEAQQTTLIFQTPDKPALIQPYGLTPARFVVTMPMETWHEKAIIRAKKEATPLPLEGVRVMIPTTLALPARIPAIPEREESQPMTDKPASLELHPKVTLTPTKAARVLEHIEAVTEFAQTGTLTHANGAKLVSYDTMTVIDLGGKRNKYSQWKAEIIAANVERVRAYVEA